MKKPLPIGIDNFSKLIQNGYYYVDKTLFIKELIDNRGEVNLFTRPRRFGKTLTLSMLQHFFEKGCDYLGKPLENEELFHGLAIMNAGENYTRHFAQYPVISLSLKSGKQPDFEMAYLSLADEIAMEFKRHKNVLEDDAVLEEDKERYRAIMGGRGDKISYAKSIAFLSQCLFAYYHQKVIILIDEYDVPLENAYFKGFYEEMIDFIRSLFESALKTNPFLEFAVITGCLRISKESIFTGLNNLKTISLLNFNYSEPFGFTQEEVDTMLSFYGAEEKREEVQRWYNGYLFGNTQVYNPWSVINYMDNCCQVRPYWSNTSSNSIVRYLIEHADRETKNEIQKLLDGGTIEKPVFEDITYDDMNKIGDSLWNFLFSTGYLKKVSGCLKDDTNYLTLSIPNTEVKYIYKNMILKWFQETIKKQDFSDLFSAIEDGDTEKIQDIITEQLAATISFHDYAENFYHGFLAGILSRSQKYIVKSNREQGNGRSDISMYTPSRRGRAFVLELKVSKSMDALEKDCRKGLEQIDQQKYEQELHMDGYQHVNSYAIAFFQKDCEVMLKTK